MVEACGSTLNHMTSLMTAVSTECVRSALVVVPNQRSHTRSCCIGFLDYIADNLKIVYPNRCRKNTARDIVNTLPKNHRVNQTYNNPIRKIPDTCALRANDICRSRTTNRGMQTMIRSKTMLITAVASKNAG